MRKTEMSAVQRDRRSHVVERLKAAGWRQGEGNTLYDADDFVEEEAVMEYSGKMGLTVSYNASEEWLGLIIEKSFGGPGVTLRMECWDALDAVLDLIVSFQGKVTQSNFRRHVADLVKICPRTKADIDGELVELDNGAPRRK